MLLPVGARTQMLLLPADPRAGASREQLEETISELLEIAYAERPEPRLHAVIGPCIGSGEPVATAASQLCRLGRYALARGETGVIWAPGYSFASLLETHAGRAGTLAEHQLAGLAGYDREHGTDLQRVLELALDHGNRNVAAHAAFMHRNTFRRKLRKALELVDADLDCPEERLALHLALKLRALERS
jgi:DNA-binding PucR family transcriptional regulator